MLIDVETMAVRLYTAYRHERVEEFIRRECAADAVPPMWPELPDYKRERFRAVAREAYRAVAEQITQIANEP